MRFVLIIIGMVGAGLLGAVFGQKLFPNEDALPESSEDYSRLAAQVDDLSAEVRNLRTELREDRASRPLSENRNSTAAAPSGAPGAGAPSGTIIFETAPDGTGAPSLTADEVIEEKVRETVNEIAREQREARAKKAEAEAVAKETAWLKEMQPHVGMTDYQVEELGKLLVERRHTFTAFKRKKAALGQNPAPQHLAAIQQEMTDYSTTLKGEVLKVVSVNQYDAIITWSTNKQKQGGGRR